MNAPARFDREPTLAELLRALPRGHLPALLERALGPRWEVRDAGGARVLGPGLDGPGRDGPGPDGAPDAAAEAPLRLGIDVLGRLSGAAAGVADAAAWLELVLAVAERYRMAAELHVESAHADYHALQAQHVALLESERRYRALSAQLEERVAAQTQAIEHAQRQIFHTEKMAAVGTLAAGMAHEINNPIGFIRSNLGSAKEYVGALAEVLLAYRRGDAAAADAAWRGHDVDALLQDFPALLAESGAGADRVAHIVQNLKAYAGVDSAGAAPADVAEAVRAAAAIVAGQLPDTVTLEVRLAPMPALRCDAGRIRQMLLALLHNARLAVADAGLIRVSGGVDGAAIRLVVEDDGCGIAPAIAARVFEPFFTTRAVGAGMGLGLTVARDIAAAHGGAIALGRGATAGTRVTVELPLAGPP
ncbi:sensor histidine kinase [Janthinobacterium fluminis]|uniref:histidine kinase n=1 Tax=Janthinobacterium fluminis TaxID=2987524 RepID=A0ABT5K6Y2_9BURK|nr:ATP-binding protein [Janthinobacterium fluminis]MDC8759522.1 ATP-binding protein [Janthinobacterium fluminis]